MEQLILEIEAYASATRSTPEGVLRAAINAKWGQWQAWKDRTASPTMKSADKLREFMRANPPVPSQPPEKDVA